MNIGYKMSEMNFYFKKLPFERGYFAPNLNELLQLNTWTLFKTENQNLKQKIRFN
jgi:hypothetical protein